MLNWNNLNQDERREYMFLQMSKSYGGNSGYLPDDSSECGVCGEPILGYGWCNFHYKRFDELWTKLKS